MKKISPFLWFDSNAEEAARFYTSIFKNSSVGHVSRYSEANSEPSGQPSGSVMTVDFELEGQSFTALNGGPVFKFNESISFMIHCENQAEIDYYWERLAEGSDSNAQQCGWLKDKFGLSWQIIPAKLGELLGGEDKAKSGRAMQALMKMKKLDIQTLEEA